MAEIKSALWAFFGIKEQQPVEEQIDRISAAGFSAKPVEKEVFDAWVKAGMPSPPEKFFKEYNGRLRRNQCTDSSSDEAAKD